MNQQGCHPGKGSKEIDEAFSCIGIEKKTTLKPATFSDLLTGECPGPLPSQPASRLIPEKIKVPNL